MQSITRKLAKAPRLLLAATFALITAFAPPVEPVEVPRGIHHGAFDRVLERYVLRSKNLDGSGWRAGRHPTPSSAAG